MRNPLRSGVFAALALAFSSFGDAFLYPFLPVHYAEVGVPVVMVGLLLSINRLVRLAANSLMVHAFLQWKFRRLTILATLLAIVSTFAYGFIGNIALWIFFRIVWGMAFATMRISSIQYALESPSKGMSVGLSRGVYEIGPMIALMIGPLIFNHAGAAATFVILGLLSLPGIFFAWQLPEMAQPETLSGSKLLGIPSSFDRLVFISAFVVEGILVVAIGYFLKDNMAMAAMLLAYRRLCLIFLSPLAGWLADRRGFEKIFNSSFFLMTFGVFGLALANSTATLVLAFTFIFTFNSVNAAPAPYNAARAGNRLKAVADNATWRDIGAATGSLLGGSLLLLPDLTLIFLIIGAVMTSALVWRWQTLTIPIERFFKWK